MRNANQEETANQYDLRQSGLRPGDVSQSLRNNPLDRTEMEAEADNFEDESAEELWRPQSYRQHSASLELDDSVKIFQNAS